jgi:AbrB family looped-hinge helix DNA binding protein
MTTAYSKVTTKAQTVIPREVRARLGLKAGDRLAYRITPEGVIIEKAEGQGDDPFATFTEWGGAADEQAFGKL